MLPLPQLLLKESFVKLTSFLTTSALLANIILVQNAKATDAPVTETQKKEIQTIIHDYLVNNPEVLIEASQALQQKQQKETQQQAQSVISANAKELFNDKFSTAGNTKGNVTIVEFFDYQCIHCKKMAPVIQALLKSNPQVKIVYKEFPIFGESSDVASKAALAAAMQGKYLPMHEALIKQEGRLNDALINQAAQSVGLNMDRFKADMASTAVANALEANRILAEKLHLMGTPAFIIAATPAGEFKANSEPTFIPGAASKEALEAFIKKASQ